MGNAVRITTPVGQLFECRATRFANFSAKGISTRPLKIAGAHLHTRRFGQRPITRYLDAGNPRLSTAVASSRRGDRANTMKGAYSRPIPSRYVFYGVCADVRGIALILPTTGVDHRE